MGLDSSDPRPTGIELRSAYEAIRAWLQANPSHLMTHPPQDAYRDFRPAIEESLPLLKALPPAVSLSDLEIRTILSELIMGKLEWAYHQSDGKYKMAAYAHAALDHAGLSFILTDEEKRALRATGSQLLPMSYSRTAYSTRNAIYCNARLYASSKKLSKYSQQIERVNYSTE